MVESWRPISGVSGRLVGPAAFKAVEGSLTRPLVGSIPIHSRPIVQRCERGRIRRKLTFKHLRKSALTGPSNDPKVPDRQIDLLAGHSAGIKEHYVVRRNGQLACEAIERHYFA